MTVPRVELSDAHRQALGIRLHHIEQALATLEREGVGASATAELRDAVARLRERTAAIDPAPPPHRLRGVAAQVVVLAGELGPRRMAGYGPVSDEAAGCLELGSRRLEALALRLVHQIESRRSVAP